MRRLRLTPRRVAVVLAATVGISAGVAYAATLSVGSWHLWAGSQTLTKATCTLTGTTQTTDASVVQANPNTANGTGTTMLVKSNSGSADWSFVSFDLSSCAIPTSGGADTATLTLFITTAPATSRTITLTPVLATWSNSLTWNIAQTLTYGSAATTTLTTGNREQHGQERAGDGRHRRVDQEPGGELRLAPQRHRRHERDDDVRHVEQRNRA